MPSPKRRKKVKGLDVPLRGDDAPLEIEPQGDDEPVAPAVLAHYAGPRFFLTARGSCVIFSPASCRLTMCGAFVPKSEKSFYDRPLVFSELESGWRVDVLAALRVALPALRVFSLCPECDAALGQDAAPVAVPEGGKKARDGFTSARVGAPDRDAQNALADAVVRAAKWVQLRGHEMPMIPDARLPSGQAQVYYAALPDGSPGYAVRFGPLAEETMA